MTYVALAWIVFLLYKAVRPHVGAVALRARLSALELRRARPRLPSLYPELADPVPLPVVSDATLRRLRELPWLSVGALAGESTSLADAGVGFARALVRELRCCDGLAAGDGDEGHVRNAPDTRTPVLCAGLGTRAHRLDGELALAGSTLRATLRLATPTGTRSATLDGGTPGDLVRLARDQCLDWLGAPPAAGALRHAVPETVDDLARLGEVLRFACECDDPATLDDRILALGEAPWTWALLPLLSELELGRKLACLVAGSSDPALALGVLVDLGRLDDTPWGYTGKADRAQRECLRRALELCPRSGLAHALAAQRSHDRTERLVHAELGALLAPTSSYTVSTYVKELVRACTPAQATGGRASQAPGKDSVRPVADREAALTRACELAREASIAWPADPDPASALIATLEARGDFARALDAARTALEYVEEPMHPRTRACLLADPLRPAWIRGAAKALQEKIATLEARDAERRQG